MRLAADAFSSRDGAVDGTLTWESLGRFVRERTLEAVAVHFAALALATDQATPEDTADAGRFSE